MIDPFSLHFCVVALFMAILGLALVTDLDSMRIPNRYCIALIILYPAYLITSASPGAWAGGVLAGLLVFVVGLLPFSAGWMGGGDVKLMAAIALWLGPQASLSFLAATSLAGGAIAIIMLTPLRFMAMRAAEIVGLSDLGEVLLGRTIPYGVAVAAGGWLIGGPYLLAAGGIPGGIPGGIH